jgi:hypothetical protein
MYTFKELVSDIFRRNPTATMLELQWLIDAELEWIVECRQWEEEKAKAMYNKSLELPF